MIGWEKTRFKKKIIKKKDGLRFGEIHEWLVEVRMNDCIDHTDILGMTTFSKWQKIIIKAFDAADLFFSSEVWTFLVSIRKVWLHILQIDLGAIKSCCWLTVMKARGSGRFLTRWIRRQPPAKCGLGERDNTRQEQCGDGAERFEER